MFKKLYNSQVFSDIIIKCKGEDGEEMQWYAHKIVLSENSNFMYKKFTVETKDKYEDVLYADCDKIIMEIILKILYNVNINISQYSVRTKIDVYKFAHYWELKSVCELLTRDLSSKVKSISHDDFLLICDECYIYPKMRILMRSYISNKDGEEFYIPSFFDLNDINILLNDNYKDDKWYIIYMELKEWGIDNNTSINELVRKYIKLDNFSIEQLNDVDLPKYFEKNVIDKYITKRGKVEYAMNNDHLRCAYVGPYIGRCVSLKNEGYNYCKKHIRYLEGKGLPVIQRKGVQIPTNN